MDTNTDPTTVIISTQPTAKELVVQAGIGIAAGAAMTLLTLGTFAAVGAIANKVQDRREAKKNQITES